MHDNRQSIWQSTDRHTQKRSQTFFLHRRRRASGTWNSERGHLCGFPLPPFFSFFFCPILLVLFSFFPASQTLLGIKAHTFFISNCPHTNGREQVPTPKHKKQHNRSTPPSFFVFFSPHPSSRQPIEALEKPESTLSALLKKDKDNASYTQRLNGRIRLFFSLFVFHRWRVLSLSAPEKKLFKKNVSLIKDSRPLSKKHNYTLLRSHIIQF